MYITNFRETIKQRGKKKYSWYAKEIKKCNVHLKPQKAEKEWKIKIRTKNKSNNWKVDIVGINPTISESFWSSVV